MLGNELVLDWGDGKLETRQKILVYLIVIFLPWT